MIKSNLRFERIAFENGGEGKSLFEITPEDVHVWGASLDIDEAELTRAVCYLSEDEQGWVNRLASGRHRQQFIAAHAALRAMLGRYCGQRPHELVIQKANAGKPFLPDHPFLRFNLTHSYGRALIAIAKNRDVGIDLEKVRREVNVENLARRFFSVRDQKFIENGEPSQKHERFLQVWVAREAVFKAEGRGITFPLYHDHVELSSDGTTGRLVRGEGGSGGADLPIRFLPLESGWIGAVAAEGTDWTVKYCGFGRSDG